MLLSLACIDAKTRRNMGKKSRRRPVEAHKASGGNDHESTTTTRISNQTRLNDAVSSCSTSEGHGILGHDDDGDGDEGHIKDLQVAVDPLMNCLSNQNPIEQQQRLIVEILSQLGIDWNSYNNDPYSSGNQSELKPHGEGILDELRLQKQADFTHCHAYALRRISEQCIVRGPSEGVDPYIFRLARAEKPNVIPKTVPLLTDKVDVKVAHHLAGPLSDFALFCSVGNAYMVEKMILHWTRAGSKERKKLLERRETTLRLPPLILTIAYSLHCSKTPGDYDRVINILLSFGADPWTTDILGRTAVHYGTDGK
jgi:hypothetical protein